MKDKIQLSDHFTYKRLIRFTLPGYLIALLIALFSLWIFERLGGAALTPTLFGVIVLAFPAAVGAAAARLIL